MYQCVFGDIRRTDVRCDKAVQDLGQRGARGRVKAGVGAFHQGLKTAIRNIKIGRAETRR
jgi:hypothetical protein